MTYKTHPFCSSLEEDAASRIKVCEPCATQAGPGLLVFPVGGEWELSLPYFNRACIYLIAICWCFLGVAIACDKFMESIEQITSSKVVFRKKGKYGDTGEYVDFLIWNPTIANLTLMALGSSAPEILLSSIEFARNEFFAGE